MTTWDEDFDEALKLGELRREERKARFMQEFKEELAGPECVACAGGGKVNSTTCMMCKGRGRIPKKD